jgi:hypothetical protein
MPSSFQQNVGASPVGRRRAERVANAVVAGYIREISRPARPAMATTSPRAPSPSVTSPGALARAADAARLRAGVRRREHASLRPRPSTVRAACLGA